MGYRSVIVLGCGGGSTCKCSRVGDPEQKMTKIKILSCCEAILA